MDIILYTYYSFCWKHTYYNISIFITLCNDTFLWHIFIIWIFFITFPWSRIKYNFYAKLTDIHFFVNIYYSYNIYVLVTYFVTHFHNIFWLYFFFYRTFMRYNCFCQLIVIIYIYQNCMYFWIYIIILNLKIILRNIKTSIFQCIVKIAYTLGYTYCWNWCSR